MALFRTLYISLARDNYCLVSLSKPFSHDCLSYLSRRQAISAEFRQRSLCVLDPLLSSRSMFFRPRSKHSNISRTSNFLRFSNLVPVVVVEGQIVLDSKHVLVGTASCFLNRQKVALGSRNRHVQHFAGFISFVWSFCGALTPQNECRLAGVLLNSMLS